MPAHLLLTPELAASLANAVRKGVPIETAAQAAGITATTFHRWLEIARDGYRHDGAEVDGQSLSVIGAFGAEISRAQAEFEAKCIENIAAAGEIVGRSGVPEWRALAWVANNHPRYRERYRQHREVEVNQSGTVKHEHTIVRGTEPDQLEEWHTALKALPEVDQ